MLGREQFKRLNLGSLVSFDDELDEARERLITSHSSDDSDDEMDKQIEQDLLQQIDQDLERDKQRVEELTLLASNLEESSRELLAHNEVTEFNIDEQPTEDALELDQALSISEETESQADEALSVSENNESKSEEVPEINVDDVQVSFQEENVEDKEEQDHSQRMSFMQPPIAGAKPALDIYLKGLQNAEVMLDDYLVDFYSLQEKLKNLKEPLSPFYRSNKSNGEVEMKRPEFQWPNEALQYLIEQAEVDLEHHQRELRHLFDVLAVHADNSEFAEQAIAVSLKIVERLYNLVTITYGIISETRSNRSVIEKLYLHDIGLLGFDKSVESELLVVTQEDLEKSDRRLQNHFNPCIDELTQLLQRFCNVDLFKTRNKITEIHRNLEARATAASNPTAFDWSDLFTQEIKSDEVTQESKRAATPVSIGVDAVPDVASVEIQTEDSTDGIEDVITIASLFPEAASPVAAIVKPMPLQIFDEMPVAPVEEKKPQASPTLSDDDFITIFKSAENGSPVFFDASPKSTASKRASSPHGLFSPRKSPRDSVEQTDHLDILDKLMKSM